ncbi:MAG: hypothetical protein HFI04_14010 [Lachnospiraceae bacterium]|nr:hypothetical protein [Lachnospiraceae bacterium]
MKNSKNGGKEYEKEIKETGSPWIIIYYDMFPFDSMWFNEGSRRKQCAGKWG